MWPFKRKQLDIASLPPLSNEQRCWRVAESVFDSSPVIIRYNESAREWIGHPDLPLKLGFAIPLNSPHDRGNTDAEENEQLNEIEDIVLREIESRSRALYALALTTSVMKEFVFYIPRGVDIKTIHETIQSVVESHDVQCMAVMEPKWDSYVQFTPP